MRMIIGAAVLMMLAGCSSDEPAHETPSSESTSEAPQVKPEKFATSEEAKAEALMLLSKAGKLGQPCDEAVELFSAAVAIQQPKLLMDAAGSTQMACSEAAGQISDLQPSSNLSKEQAASLTSILDEISNGLAVRAEVGRGVQSAHGSLDGIDSNTKNAIISIKNTDSSIVEDLMALGKLFGASPNELSKAIGKNYNAGKK